MQEGVFAPAFWVTLLDSDAIAGGIMLDKSLIPSFGSPADCSAVSGGPRSAGRGPLGPEELRSLILARSPAEDYRHNGSRTRHYGKHPLAGHQYVFVPAPGING